jgi:hypothetical protein
MAFTCSCASPDCTVNGCARLRRYETQPIGVWPILSPPDYSPPPPARTYVPLPLTAEDVRRIVREEIERSKEPT